MNKVPWYQTVDSQWVSLCGGWVSRSSFPWYSFCPVVALSLDWLAGSLVLEMVVGATRL